jgi:hypothetical protein
MHPAAEKLTAPETRVFGQIFDLLQLEQQLS